MNDKEVDTVINPSKTALINRVKILSVDKEIKRE